MELYFITGADALASILTWRGAEELFELAQFVGVSRPGVDLSSKDFSHLPADKVTHLEVPALAISSTECRARLVRAGEPRPAGGYRNALAEPADLVHRPVGHDSAVIDDHYPVGGIGGFLQIVGGEQDRPAVCRLGAHGAPESRSGGGIQARGRLVQDQQLGLAQQGERQPDALDLAAGAFGDPAVQQPTQIGLGDDRGRRGRPHL